MNLIFAVVTVFRTDHESLAFFNIFCYISVLLLEASPKNPSLPWHRIKSRVILRQHLDAEKRFFIGLLCERTLKIQLLLMFFEICQFEVYYLAI